MTGDIENAEIRALTHLIGHDAAGLFGRASLGACLAPRSPNLLAVIGDSTAEQVHLDSQRRNRAAYNHVFLGSAMAGARLILSGNFGKSGDRTDQTAARLPAALSSGAGALYISEGMNNFSQAPYTHAVSGAVVTPAQAGAQAFADTLAKIDAALALGLKVIVALCAGASNFSAAMIGQMWIYNQALRRAAELRPNLWLLDMPAILHDPASTPVSIAFRAGYLHTGDAVLAHESVTGAYHAAKAFAEILREVMRPLPRSRVSRANQRSADNRLQLALNPLFNATSGAAGVLGAGGSLASGTTAVPYEWTVARSSGDTTTSFQLGVEANAEGGNDLVIAYSVSTAGGGLRVYQDLAGSSSFWQAGDVLQGFSTVTIMAGSAGLACARPYIEINGVTAGVGATMIASGVMSDTAHGVFPTVETFVLEDATEPIAVPAYDTKGYLSFKALGLICAAPGAGVVRLRMPHLDVRSTLI
ncbi:SGNH/GDSL hydrolase family protein [Rhizobium sp. G21]|uniref:SGNH/GDSL hydrolase family protein n=1 Tax=Rhizobium sp. G21 TaxID=2758439 RepID=UPI0016016DB5|nr:SGNH/GDSL hydrolase family protein [Rhizobium sp. G21]MBB1250518.1 SGNH/GDSL hydrolase family protein [Rhizobium sp. G21]